MNEVVYIILSVVGILSIPIILLLAWWLFLICQKTLDEIFTTIHSLRGSIINFANDTKKYHDKVREFTTESERDLLYRKEGEKELKKKIWGKIVVLINDHYIAVVLLVSLVVGTIFAIVTFGANSSVPDNERVVLAFVGVLATFIVITNHSQVYSAEQRIERKTKELQDLVEKQEQSSAELLHNLNTELQRSKKNNLFLTYKFVEACQNSNAFELAKTIARGIIETPEKIYDITIKNGENVNVTLKAKIRIERNRLVYYYVEGGNVGNGDVEQIDGHPYTKDAVDLIVANLVEIFKETKKAQS